MLSISQLKQTPNLPSKMEDLAIALDGVILDDPSQSELPEWLWAEDDGLYESVQGFAVRLQMGCMWCEGHWEALAETLGWVRDLLKEVDDLHIKFALAAITTN